MLRNSIRQKLVSFVLLPQTNANDFGFTCISLFNYFGIFFLIKFESFISTVSITFFKYVK